MDAKLIEARPYARRLPDADALPAELRARSQWVCWRLKAPEKAGDKPGKVPVNPNTGKNADPTIPATWSAFDSAVGLWKRDASLTGVGYVFAADDPYVGVDIDKCRDPATGALTSDAQAIVDQLDTFTEISVGLTGVHSIARGVLDPAAKKKTGDYEMYSCKRFFTVSGLVMRDAPIRDAQADLDAIRIKYIGERQQTESARELPASRDWTSEQLAKEVTDILKRAEGDESFLKLWAGNWQENFTSQSEADLSFCGKLASYCHRDPALMDATFRESGLMRAKWERRDDYRDGTLTKALSSGHHAAPSVVEDYIVTAADQPAARKSSLLGPAASRFTLAELIELPPEPKVIVDGYMLLDAGTLVAPGGMGKTTLAIQECVHIILGKPLYGREVKRPGAVLFITAEDDRGTTLHRLHHICVGMRLTHEEIQRVQHGFFIEDISASSARLVRMVDGEPRPTQLLRDITDGYTRAGISYVHLDPVSLLGPGEMAGNDGMAELLRTARRLSRELDSAVRLVHHVAKAVARDGTADQYAGRGGSAFADNARFVHQLQSVDSSEFKYEGRKYLVGESVPHAAVEIAGRSAFALMTHKLSYQRRDQHPVFLVRSGFSFTDYRAIPMEAAAEATLERRNERVEAVVAYVRARLEEGQKLTARTLEKDHLSELGMKQAAVRVAVDMALQSGRLVEKELPEGELKGSRKTYLAPADDESLAVPTKG